MNFFKKDKSQNGGADLGNYDDSQVPVQLKKIMDHLGFLEKKLDTLLEQSRHRGDARPSFGGSRPFSGPRGGHFRPNNREGYNRGNDNRGNRYEGNREGNREGHREGNRPPRPGNHSGRPYQKKYTPNTSHAPQGNTREA